jgi:hypothetical protein
MATLGLLLFFVAGCSPAASSSRSRDQATERPVRRTETVRNAPVRAASERSSKPAARSFASIDVAIQTLVSAADSRDTESRLQASDWLARQGSAAVGPLKAVLDDEQAGTAARIAACRVLGRLGPQALEALTAQLDSDDQMVRINALNQLPHLDPLPPAVVSTLIHVLDHEDARMRARAIQGLASLGPKAEAAAPRLQQILNSGDQDQLRSEAKKALQQVDPRRTLTFD